MNIPDRPSTNSTVLLCGHCAGLGRIESMDYGGTSVCGYCHGSGVEASESCNMCSGRGLIVNRNHDSFRCPTCDGVGRMPNAHIINQPEEERVMTRSVSPQRRMGRGDQIDGWDLGPPRMSFRYAPPADAENVELSRRNLMSQAAAMVNCSMSIGVGPATTSEEKDKTLNCIRIAEHVLQRNTNETDPVVSSLKTLPDHVIERIMDLLKIKTQNDPPKRLNRFQILKQE